MLAANALMRIPPVDLDHEKLVLRLSPGGEREKNFFIQNRSWQGCCHSNMQAVNCSNLV